MVNCIIKFLRKTIVDQMRIFLKVEYAKEMLHHCIKFF